MILVSGGTGMLGAHLLHKLVKENNKVRALKRKSSNLNIVRQIFSYYSDNHEELFEKIEWFDGDILDSESILCGMEGVEFLYHVAAMVSFAPRDKEQMIGNNVRGTQNLVNAALVHDIKKFCHVSSISALGEATNGELITEETFRNPKGRHSGYSISKYLSELEVWRGITEGLNAVIVNPSIILGPGNWDSGSPSIFSNINKGLRFYTEGITGYVDVLDVVDIMTSLMESSIKGERYIVSGENLSFKDIFSEIAVTLGVKKPSIKANNLMLGIAWRLETLKSRILNVQPKVTKDSAFSAQKLALFSSEKLIDAIDFKYTPISDCVLRIAKNYKESLNN